MMYLGSITLVLSITSVISDETIDTSHIKVFPATNQSIAGVFQVSLLDHLNQPQYAFNASAARSLCSSLGVNIASKAQIQEALKRGLETCRFGWVDENLAVIPRIKALFNCGQNQTGVVAWRAPVIKQFDVFCFNESDAATVSSRDYSGETQSTSKTTISTQTTHTTSSASLHPSSSSAPKTIDWEAEPARFVSTAQGSAGGTRMNDVCHLWFTMYRKYSTSENINKSKGILSKVFGCDCCFERLRLFHFMLFFQQRLSSSHQPVPFFLLQ
uniref:Link domain-containing protein n=1 Tax=Anabas testudineus TaxID=64144 RepID=A0A3Q1HUZ7_ANATE